MNRKTAGLAGLFFLLMVVFGLFAEIFFRQKLFVAGDAAATARNILSNELLFRAGIASDLLMALCYLITALLLYRLLSGVDKNLATLMVVFAAAGSVLLMGNVLLEFAPLVILNGTEFLSPLGEGQIQGLALLCYQMYQHGYMIGQIFFSLWVLPLGMLIYRSRFIPRLFGVFFIAETVFGLAAAIIHFMMPNGLVESVAMIPMMVAEFSFMGYLLTAGLRRRIETQQAVQAG